MPSRQRLGQRVPLRLVTGADLLLEGLVLLFELGEVPLGLGRDLGHLAVVGLDGLAHLAGLVRLDLDHPLGVDLVDLAEPLVADRLAGGDGAGVVLLGPLQVLLVPRGQPLAFLGELGVGLRPAVGIQAIGVGQRLAERLVEPLELGLRELDEPGPEQPADRQPGDRTARRRPATPRSSTRARPTRRGPRSG